MNHPHICTLYDVGPNYLVMELCEGETLAARLKRGKLSLEETLRCGAQIADALAEAHSKGITHRAPLAFRAANFSPHEPIDVYL